MPSYCAVKGCKNAGGMEGIFFHRFPKNEERRKAWIQFCKRKDQINADSSVICSKHFEPEAYERDLRNELLGLPLRRLLIPDAVPTIFDSGNTNTARNGTIDEEEQRKLIEDFLSESQSRDHCDDNDEDDPQDVEQKPEITVKQEMSDQVEVKTEPVDDGFADLSNLDHGQNQPDFMHSSHKIFDAVPIPVDDLQPYLCDLCGSCFSELSYLTNHYNKLHRKQRKPYHHSRNRKALKVPKWETSEADCKPFGLFHASSDGIE